MCLARLGGVKAQQYHPVELALNQGGEDGGRSLTETHKSPLPLTCQSPCVLAFSALPLSGHQLVRESKHDITVASRVPRIPRPNPQYMTRQALLENIQRCHPTPHVERRKVRQAGMLEKLRV